MSASFRDIKEFTVPPESSGERLDRWLAAMKVVPSRSRAAELIARGLVTLENKPLKPSYKVQSGNLICVEIPEAPPSSLQPLNAPLDLMFEDEDILVVNKPSGLVVHPAAGHAQDTLVNILLHHVGQLSMGFNENRPGIVHRLDRDTSGILVVAKNDSAHHLLAQQFRLKTAHRMYWALVYGVPQKKQDTLRSNLSRHPQDRKRFASGVQGKHAITHYRLREALPSKISWLECILETGRTHQIRVHLSENGLPILGDPIYGRKSVNVNLAKEIPRLALHACELGFLHPRSGEKMNYRIGWPTDLNALVTRLGFKNV